MENIYVLKFGGNAISGRQDLDRLSKEIADLISDGAKIVVVHGGGPEINKALEDKGIVPKKVAGLRITDDATMEVVEETLRGINEDVVDSLTDAGVKAVGIPGYFVTACGKKEPYTALENGKEVTVDLQNVGEVQLIFPRSLHDLLDKGVTPVVYPIGADKNGKHLNVNADSMASGIAAGLKCTEMIQITDVPGIMLDVNDPSSKQNVLTLAEVDRLIAEGIISGGMIPKVEACRRALKEGVSKVRIVNGKDPRSIVSDVMRSVDHGTVIYGDKMRFDEIKEKSGSYLFQNYGRIDLSFERGEGAYLWDSEGNRYLDLVAGIAVNSIGYSHPKWVAAVQEQAGRLVHVSNLYNVKEQALAAEAIASVTPKGLDRTVFVNSGAEANEGSMKVAVRYTGKKKVLSALNSFHGRTAAALGATGQTKYQDTFQTLISGCFDYFDYGSSESVKGMIDKDTAAVIVEPIQGEGGVKTVPAEFFKTVRDECTDKGALMIVDEVQTGMGRTGKWFGIENFGVVPDIMSLAKALGGGVPVGAVVTSEDISRVMTPGTHGTTFGGTPLVCTAVKATIDIMKEEKLVENSAKIGAYLKDGISKVKSPEITAVRGYGLMIGMEMASKASDFQKHCRDNGVLVNVCHGNTVRLIPPLIIGKRESDVFLRLLKDYLQ